LAIPADKGLDRLLWAVPMIAIAAMAVQLIRMGRRWSKRTAEPSEATPVPSSEIAGLDDQIESELKRMDEDA